MIQRFVRERHSNDLGTPILDQLIVAKLMEDYDAILDERRALLRRGREQLLGLLAQKLPEWSVPVPSGGLTAWANLGHAVSSQLAIAARNEGLVIAAGPRFGIDGAFERFIRIPYSYSPDDLDRGVDALARAWAAVGSMPALEPTGELAGVV